MKIKPWLLSSYFIVMILPIVSLYFFYVSLAHYDERRDFLEIMEMKEKVDAIDQKLADPSLYKLQPVENYQELRKMTDKSMNISLYRKDGLKLYSTMENAGFDISSTTQRKLIELYKDLNTIKKKHRTNSYKQTVFNGSELIGIYEITVVRNDWLQGVNDRTLLLGGFLGVSFIMIYSAVVILLNRKLNRPLNMLREEMMAFANGEKGRKNLIHSNDELGELIKHFEKMKAQIDKTNEEVQRQQKEKEYIVAALSHDLKTPLTAIRAYSEAINGNTDLTEKEKFEYRTIIFEKLDYMKAMIDDLTLYTSLKSAKEKIEFVQVEGDEFFEMLLGGYHEPCTKKNICLTVEQLVSGNYLLNARQMIRVVDNLMANAIRYTGEGNKVWLAAISKSNVLPEWIFPPFVRELEAWRKSGVVLLIQNEGKAIPVEGLENVFEPFVQLEGARGQGGTSGLGLSIAKIAIEQHGGKIKLWSQAGYGTLIACWIEEG